MAAELHVTPSRATDADGLNLSGAKWFFYLTGTSTPESVFTTAALSVAHANPVVADAAGKFAPIYFDATKLYRGVLKTNDEATTIYDIDPINEAALASLVTASGAGLVGFSHASTYDAGTIGDHLKRFVVVTDAPYSAAGNGIATTDGASIQDAMDDVAAAGGGIVYVPEGTYLSAIKLQIPNRVELKGAGYSCTTIKATNTFSQTSLLTNLTHDGTQQFASVSDIALDGNEGNGAVCSTAVLHICSVFVDSGIRRVLVQEGSANGIKIECANGLGPFIVQDVWCVRNNASNFFYEATGTGNAANGLYVYNLTAEHQPTGQTSVRFKDTTGAGVSTGFFIKGLHIEQENTGASTKCLVIDGIKGMTIEDVQLLASTPSSHTGIEITNNANNARIQIREVANENAIQAVLSDLKNSYTELAVNVGFYTTPDVGVNRNGYQDITYAATMTPNVALGNYCTIVATNTTAFTIANPTNMVNGQELTLEIVNASGGALGAITWGADFAYKSWTAPATGFRKTIHFRKRNGVLVQVGDISPDL